VDVYGLVPALMAGEITARVGRNPARLYAELVQALGEPFADRVKSPATAAQKARLAVLASGGISGIIGESGNSSNSSISNSSSKINGINGINGNSGNSGNSGMTAGELAGEAITAVLDHAKGNGAAIGGIKVVTKNGWFAARPSGTEDIYKIYAESFSGRDHRQRILKEAQALVDGAMAAP